MCYIIMQVYILHICLPAYLGLSTSYCLTFSRIELVVIQTLYESWSLFVFHFVKHEAISTTSYPFNDKLDLPKSYNTAFLQSVKKL